MTLDPFSVSVLTSLVVVVSGVLYLLETLLRKDGAAGRLWSVAFLSGILTVLSYMIWTVSPSAFVAVATGNAGFVASAAFMWLGARAFNVRSLRTAGIVVAAGIFVPFVAALLPGPDGGDWAGAVWMFICVAAFAALGAVESRRGAMGRRWSSVGLTVVLGVEAAFFVVRTILFLTIGPDDAFFETWFGSTNSSLLTVTLTITVVVTTSVLRASESNLRGQRDTYQLHVGLDGVLLRASFRSAVTTMLERAHRQQETVCLVAVRIDDIPRVATAFGPGEAEALAGAWRSGVRRYAPTASMVGDGDSSTLLIAFLTTSFADVRRLASILHRRLLDDVTALGISVVPVIGVGIALTDQAGYDFETLADAALHAARRSSSSPDASVIVAEG